MAVSVRFLLDYIKDDLPGAISQVAVGGLAGVAIYAVLVLLTERELLKKLLQLLRERRTPAANAGLGS
jgi:succinoglycan exporter